MSNKITSIDSLINQSSSSNSEDADREFLRDAAEAIIATSVNNKIDPSILELLKRIQYASSSKAILKKDDNNSNNKTSEQIHDILAGLDYSSRPGPSNNSVQLEKLHFPSFNLSYSNNFDEQLLQNSLETTATITPTIGTLTSTPSGSWPHDFSSSSSTAMATSFSSRIVTTPPVSTSLSQSSVPLHDTPQSTASDSSPGSSIATSEKPFICTNCSLSFRRSSDLRRHQRAHLPVLPNICPLCGKGFARKDALKRHSDTLTCKRNREKLLSAGGDVESILTQAQLNDK